MSLPLNLLKRMIKAGTLCVVLPDGNEHNIGSGEPSVSWNIHKKGTLGKIARNPFLNLGETYIEQEWDVQDNRLTDSIDGVAIQLGGIVFGPITSVLHPCINPVLEQH